MNIGNIVPRRTYIALASSCNKKFYSGQYSPIFMQYKPYIIVKTVHSNNATGKGRTNLVYNGKNNNKSHLFHVNKYN